MLYHPISCNIHRVPGHFISARRKPEMQCKSQPGSKYTIFNYPLYNMHVALYVDFKNVSTKYHEHTFKINMPSINIIF
jgi:hypothetical protein